MKHKVDFEWDENKDKTNKRKHGVSFALAQLVFLDNSRIILEDLEHGISEILLSGKSFWRYIDCKVYIPFKQN